MHDEPTTVVNQRYLGALPRDSALIRPTEKCLRRRTARCPALDTLQMLVHRGGNKGGQEIRGDSHLLRS
jgi:hypothetical protein